ncbi:unnamed protein product [Rotaria magnacalcarata]|uniref:Helix-turn-helix domain-containing protein n=2 Tax=Rotaria magnacalcarata TaxID=392030 RepID=A0A815N437_9BILA|nr:unnamed protein product [Rotaria magnacalcarata]CAF2134406.1 unnamed protein product [Rotaria magnacalcarata]
MNMPTTEISKFLDKLIRPIFDKHARSIIIIDGVDLIQRLEAYTTNGYLKPKTSLCKYVDDFFFMPNDSLESIDQMLDEANNFHPNIKLVRQIGRSVPFRDVFLHNSNGALKTSVYHKEVAEPYVVPFESDHPDHVFRNTVDTAIMRAARCSTTFSQFEDEIRPMKLMFLYNGYSPIHIDWRLTTLFSKHLQNNFILTMLNSSDEFGYLRHQLLTTSTNTEYDKATDN